MRSALAVLMMALLAGFSAHAGELDNEKSVTNEQIQLAQDLPATLVIRVNESTKEVEVLHSKDRLATDEATKNTVVNSGEFKKMDVKGQMTGSELDQDSSRSSWYFCWPTYNYYYPTYYYYGYQYNYSNYYWYNWGGYSYYYYGWGSYGRWW